MADKTLDFSSKIEEIKIDEQMFEKTFITRQDKVLQSQSGHPTHKPTNYKEQFYFEDNGSLWVNIGNVWREYGPI